ncbi:MAG: hypothetical protein QF451_17490 [Nitrospinota bacterium]|jgi:hypothetical protein|nr:hypothetical protein [Nitrospinota bacterium]
MIRRLAAALAAALLIAGPNAAAPQKTKSRFQVDGTSVILRQNRATAQSRAVGAGIRKAVYQAVLQSMGEAAMVQFRSRIDGSILKEAGRYVHSYRMLRHEVDEDAKLVRVGLEVVVDLTAVNEAIRSLQLARVKKGETRLLFLVVEQIFRSGARGGREAIRLEGNKLGTAERRIMLDFARAGYTPINPRGQAVPARPGQILAAVRGDVDAARALGSLYGCPFVITASAIVERERGGAVVGLANARVIRVDDGAVLAIRSRQVRIPRARRDAGRPRAKERGAEASGPKRGALREAVI